jgi:hypothetical protein
MGRKWRLKIAYGIWVSQLFSDVVRLLLLARYLEIYAVTIETLTAPRWGSMMHLWKCPTIYKETPATLLHALVSRPKTLISGLPGPYRWYMFEWNRLYK